MNRVARVLAPAKVNLRLVVLSRETSGYHNLETLFCGVSLADRLEIRPDRGLKLETVGNDIDTGPAENNLVLRAARLFFERTGVPPNVRMRLEKRIPSAAGLGGGSSDAAATLKALNTLYDSPLGSQELLDSGSLLGSDVPFFLGRSPFALGWSRGERLLALRPPAAAHVLLVHTGVDVHTPWAFGQLSAGRDAGRLSKPTAIALRLDDLRDWAGIATLAHNDFEAVVADRIPHLPALLSTLRKSGGRLALLSGTGGSLFGIFDDRSSAESAHRAITSGGAATASICRTIRKWPGVRIAPA